MSNCIDEYEKARNWQFTISERLLLEDYDKFSKEFFKLNRTIVRHYDDP